MHEKGAVAGASSHDRRRVERDRPVDDRSAGQVALDHEAFAVGEGGGGGDRSGLTAFLQRSGDLRGLGGRDEAAFHVGFGQGRGESGAEDESGEGQLQSGHDGYPFVRCVVVDDRNMRLPLRFRIAADFATELH